MATRFSQKVLATDKKNNLYLADGPSKNFGVFGLKCQGAISRILVLMMNSLKKMLLVSGGHVAK